MGASLIGFECFYVRGDCSCMADLRLQIFHAVAKHLSFTKAAETLFMTQPAVTFQIKQLEEHLNTRLFDRAQGRISLTPAGQVALDYAERILALSAELDTRLKEMSGQAAGPLLIGASMTIGEYVLPQLIGKFKAQFPAVVPTLFVGNSEAVQDRVAERTLDLGFIEGDSHLASLSSEVCCEDELHVVCAPSHPLANEQFAPDRKSTRLNSSHQLSSYAVFCLKKKKKKKVPTEEQEEVTVNSIWVLSGEHR